MTSFILVNRYEYFRGACCHYLRVAQQDGIKIE